MLIHMSNATLDEFYPSIAIATLMRIIRDNTLAQHHTSVVQVGLAKNRISFEMIKNCISINNAILFRPSHLFSSL